MNKIEQKKKIIKIKKKEKKTEERHFLIIDLFHIVCAHAYIGHVARYFSIISETLQRWGKQILSH